MGFWGGWLVVTGLVLSFMAGTVHPYYAVVLAPAVAALVAIVGRLAWRARRGLVGILGLASMAAATGLMSVALLNAAGWHPERYVVLAAASAAVFAVLSNALWRGRSAAVVAAVSAAAALAGAGAIGLATASMTHSGSIPSAGAVSTSARRSGRRTSATSDSALVTALRESTTRWAAAASSLDDRRPCSVWPAALRSCRSVASTAVTRRSPLSRLSGPRRLGADPLLHRRRHGRRAGWSRWRAGQHGASISAWVTSTYTATTLGGTTVYDLTASA